MMLSQQRCRLTYRQAHHSGVTAFYPFNPSPGQALYTIAAGFIFMLTGGNVMRYLLLGEADHFNCGRRQNHLYFVQVSQRNCSMYLMCAAG